MTEWKKNYCVFWKDGGITPKKVMFWVKKSVRVKTSDALSLEFLYKLTQLQIVKPKSVVCSLFRRNRSDETPTVMMGSVSAISKVILTQ